MFAVSVKLLLKKGLQALGVFWTLVILHSGIDVAVMTPVFFFY